MKKWNGYRYKQAIDNERREIIKKTYLVRSSSNVPLPPIWYSRDFVSIMPQDFFI